jgi:mycofactocin system glycosyltransferase
LKQVSYANLTAGTYRLARDIHIAGDYAICEYPLRAVRLNATTRQLLSLCGDGCTCQKLAAQINLPIKRIEALCKQLYWKGLLDAGPYEPPVKWPEVSIIIPTHNRASQLERCLRSLLALEYPASRLEVIVVDDGSTDDTGTLLQQLALVFSNKGSRLRIVRHAERLGVATSRNSGAELAQSELLAYIDSDCVASPCWLSELVPAFQDAAIGAVGGMIRAYERKSTLGRYEDVRSSLFMGVRPQQVQLKGPITYLPTANLLVRRGLWEQVGGFAPLTFGEDVDFCRRLLASGSRILYLPQGTVYHDYRTSMKAFLQIHAAYASSEAPLLQRHPDERRILILPPEQAAFAALVLGGIWGMLLGVMRQLTSKGNVSPSIWGGGLAGADHGGGRPPGSPPHIHNHPRPYNDHEAPLQGRGVIVGAGAVGRRSGDPCNRPGGKSIQLSRRQPAQDILPGLLAIILAILLTLPGTRKRVKQVRARRLPIGPLTVLRATIRGHLAYTYHLCRHLTRYYTLPLLAAGLLLPPLILLVFIMCGIVIGVDYARLRPEMGLGRYALCSLLDDCAYEIGVLLGCIKQRTWKPLVPVIRRKNPTARSL